MESLEAPTPYKPNASFEKQCSIKIEQNNMTYILNSGIVGESVYFELYDIKNENYKYMNISSLNTLKKLNFWFNQFSSLEKLIKVIKNIMNSNKFKIREDKNDINVIYFSNPLDDEDIIYLELHKEEKSQKEIIKDLLNAIKELKEKNQYLENKIINIEKNFNDKISALENQINNINKKLENNDQSIKENSIDSLIISKIEDIKLLKGWISPNQKVTFELIYRASRDGDTTKDFHRMCDNKSPTICLLKTPGGYIFGGYTTILFNNPNKKEFILKDEKAFVFSLNKKEKFFSKDGNNSIYIHPDYLIIFGDGSNSIQIENNAFQANNHWSNPKGSYGINLNLTENKYFSIVEMEVFQVKFI